MKKLAVSFFWKGWRPRPRLMVQRNYPEFGGFTACVGPIGVIVRRA